MEEKELNFCEILKGHENELFYSPIFGEVYLNAILTKGQPYPISLIAGGKERWINANGYWDNDYTENTMLVLYPSREAYATLIDKIYGYGTWESNPYVFVYEFELMK